MPDGHHPTPLFFQEQRDLTGGLALAAAGAHRTHGDHRSAAFDHGFIRAQEDEAGPGRLYQRSLVHDVCMGGVAVGEKDLIDLFLSYQAGEVLFGVYGDSIGV